jgi:hypothetical protein
MKNDELLIINDSVLERWIPQDRLKVGIAGYGVVRKRRQVFVQESPV